MSLWTWNENFSVNVAEIDSQHKTLVRMTNDLYEAMSVGKGRDALAPLLRSLASYAGTHFATEERYLIQYKYSAYPQHKQEHALFERKVLDLQDEYSAGRLTLSIEVMNFLKDWLSRHILGTDKQYAPFLNEKGLR